MFELIYAQSRYLDMVLPHATRPTSFTSPNMSDVVDELIGAMYQQSTPFPPQAQPYGTPHYHISTSPYQGPTTHEWPTLSRELPDWIFYPKPVSTNGFWPSPSHDQWDGCSNHILWRETGLCTSTTTNAILTIPYSASRSDHSANPTSWG